MKEKKEKVSVIIPVYNSEKTIKEVVETLIKTMESKIDYEILLVDDASQDNSWEVCRALSKNAPAVTSIQLNRNFGQPNAKMAGLHYVTGDYIVYMDDDLQNPPESIFKLIDEIRKGYDVIFSYAPKKQQSLFKNIGSRLNDWMATQLLGKPKTLKFSSFFIFRRLIADELKKYTGAFPYPSGVILQLTTNIGAVEIEHYPRKMGSSNYTLSKLLNLWLNGFTNFSIIPLRMASFFGMIFCLSSAVFIIYLIARKLMNPAEILGGWTSVMVIILFVGGVQMLFLGLIGEYIGRVLLLVNGKPQFVVKKIVRQNRESPNKNL